MSAEYPIIMTYIKQLSLAGMINSPQKYENHNVRTEMEIIRDPTKINGLRLPYFEEHLSLHIPTHG